MRNRDTILVAEDAEGDAFVLQRAFERADIDAELRFVEDGQEAVDYLSGIGAFADRKANPMPKLLLLDLRMPRLSGFDVLGWLKKDANLRRLPVAVFSSSNMDKDVDRAYDLGANSYIVKPASLGGYTEFIATLNRYWNEINRVSAFDVLCLLNYFVNR
jgi:CheY-like chemotaxis protein